MSSYSRIPPLLQPHTRLPKDDSILLLTSTLGASSNWLIVRFLCEALHRDPSAKTDEHGEEDVAVILVSWMRDWEFWRSEARKGGGLDLKRLKREKKFAFVDGLSKMFLKDISGEKATTSPGPEGRPLAPNTTTGVGGPIGRTPQTILPVRGPPGRITPRTPATATGATPVSQASATASAPQTSASSSGQFFITSPELKDVQRTIESAIRHVDSHSPRRRPFLILDMPSFLLASNPTISQPELSSTLLKLHSLTSHILVHIPADDALIALSDPPQPLEIDAHNFLVKTAHMSSRILSCRVLDTGYAKDVSGVLSVTENDIGFKNLELRKDKDPNAEEKRGRELLYLVKGDGSVKMFERGAGGEA